MKRKCIKGILECIHMLLIFAIIVPAIYMIGMSRETGMIYRLYLADMLLLIPFVLFAVAQEYCRKLWQYLLAYVVVTIGMTALSLGVGKGFLSDSVSDGYVAYIIIGTIAGAVKDYSVRMNKVRAQKAKEENDSTWRAKENSLAKPKMGYSFLFVGIYVVALNFACPEVCNIALISTICYLLVAIAYQYIEKMEHYLVMNDGVCKVRNIPYKRIFGIGKVFLLTYLILLLLAMIPTWMTVRYRKYTDYREWVLERKGDYEELFAYEKPQTGNGDPMQDLAASYGPLKDTPILLKLTIYGMGAAAVLFLAGIVIRWIYSEIMDFARNVKEEDDKVEMLDEPDKEEQIPVSRFSLKKTEGDKIRIRYRKYIRKHRKERPAAYETPEEIEKAAGVADTEEGKELHCRYEEVRYGKT